MKALRTISIVAAREMRMILADKWSTVAMFLVPLVAGVLLAAIYAGQVVRDVPTIVIDHDDSEVSRAFIRALDANEGIAVVRTTPVSVDPEETIRGGEVQTVVDIPESFGAHLKSGQPKRIICWINSTNVVTSNYAIKGLNAVAGTVAAGIGVQTVSKKGVDPAHAAGVIAPIMITTRLLYNPGQNYANFFLPGTLAALLQQVVVIGSVLTWVKEFKRSKIGELRAISGGLPAMIAGKLLVYVLIGLGWSVVFFVGLFALVAVPCEGSLLAALTMLVLMLTGMTLMAMVISSLCPEPETAMQVAFIVSSPAFLMSGYTFPTMAMAPVARWIGALVPLTPFLRAWRRIVLYGGALGDVVPETGSMLILIAVSFGMLTTILWWRMRPAAAMDKGER